MLTARKIPRACQSCRLRLLTLFEHGFTNIPAYTTSRMRYSTRANLQAQNLQPRHHASLRSFSTTSRRPEEVKSDLSSEPASSTTNIESVVRQARQTFGETLPKDYLSAEEYILYERLYGPPLRETRPDDLEYMPDVEADENPVENKAKNVLLREGAEGLYEEVDFDAELGYSVVEEEEPFELGEEELNALRQEALRKMQEYEEQAEVVFEDQASHLDVEKLPNSVQVHGGKNQREIDAISRLQKDMTEAASKPIEPEEEEEEYEEEEEIEEEEEEDVEDKAWISSDSVRTHPHTQTGRSRTHPMTLSLPSEGLLEPVSELLARTNPKHLADAAENAFGGKGLPYSASTPKSKNNLTQKHIGLDVFQHRMSDVEADAYLAVVMPGTYASVMSTLVEIRKRLGSEWIRDLITRGEGGGPRVLDAGAGGAGIVAWREILQAEWNVMKAEGMVKGERVPYGKSTVLTGSNTLRHRISRFLDDTVFLPRLPDYIHASNSEALLDGASPQPRKAYDIIIAPHTLFPLKEDFRRKNMIQNLWSLLDPNGGVLILIEKGLPRGFEAIAGARALLLKSHISSPEETIFENELQSPESDEARFVLKEEGMIIAPCTNHKQCPMYPVPGLSTGRKDFCHFSQRIIRPQYLQKVLGAKIRNHEDIKFSYLAVRRGVDARKGANPILQGDAATLQAFKGYEEHDLPETGEQNDVRFNALSLPRIILPSIKSRGHITFDLCTPSAKLERWIVPRSFSQAAYRDARKSKWGDLWALGAKTRTERSPRLGRLGRDEDGKGQKIKGIRDGKIGKGGKKMKKTQYDMIVGRKGFEDIKESPQSAKYVKREKRTKGGRFAKAPRTLDDEL